jgi:hypothetical protein
MMTRFNSKIVTQPIAQVLVGAKRICLPSGSVKSSHELPDWSFSERVFGDEASDLRDQSVMAAEH